MHKLSSVLFISYSARAVHIFYITFVCEWYDTSSSLARPLSNCNVDSVLYSFPAVIEIYSDISTVNISSFLCYSVQCGISCLSLCKGLPLSAMHGSRCFATWLCNNSIAFLLISISWKTHDKNISCGTTYMTSLFLFCIWTW